MKDTNCEKCKKEVNQKKIKYRVAIPETILSVDAIHILTNASYVRNHDNFCSEQCYNLSLLDELINRYGFALMTPEDNFLNPEKDVPQAKETLRELQDFKTEYAS
ncbi:hypothetical protein [Priestia sp. J2]|uniref:hypothetical protein n=1 Tax=Priestia sp. J2 TaxID=2886505 RepID=UPI001E547ED0|nr:hypothetical protein [Priestia sp. J2]